MGSHNINFKDFGGGELSYNRPPGDLLLSRQPSVYSLTFDEFQSGTGGSVKDFGSMNMDELLKSIWIEENKVVASTSIGGQDPGSNMPRQGSLTLPRTLSHMTVDAVWRDISKEFLPGKDAGEFGVAPVTPYSQLTFGEVTLEEFLERAGVVREDAAFGGKLCNGNFPRDLAGIDNSTGLGVRQLEQSENLVDVNNNSILIQPSNVSQNLNRVRPNQPQQISLDRPLLHILPKNPKKPSFNGSINGPGIMGGLPDQAACGVLKNEGIGMVAPILGSLNSPSNPVLSNGMARSSRDSSLVSQLPYVFNSGLRGRKSSATLEKVIERRQKRMIKNRESAERSRARKQAYTMELEAEVANLKVQNQDLRKKQAEFVEKQKNQVLELMNVCSGGKRRCLRRTRTGMW